MTVARRFDHAGLEVIEQSECLRLMTTVPVGRLVFTEGGLPAVRLVNFFVDGDTLVFSTADGGKYRAAERGDVVAFETDAIDPERHSGWTVTAVGHLSTPSEEENQQIAGSLPLRAWAPSGGLHFIRLGIETLQGRRIVAWAQRPHTTR